MKTKMFLGFTLLLAMSVTLGLLTGCPATTAGDNGGSSSVAPPVPFPSPVPISNVTEVFTIMSNTNTVSGWNFDSAWNLTGIAGYPSYAANALVQTCFNWAGAPLPADGTISNDTTGSSFDGTGTPEILVIAGGVGPTAVNEHIFRINATNNTTLSNGIDAFVTNLLRFSNGNLCFNIKIDATNTSALYYNKNSVFWVGLERTRHSGVSSSIPLCNPKATYVPLGAGTNGFALDGAWHKVQIPLSAFYNAQYSTNQVSTNSVYIAGLTNPGYQSVTLSVGDLAYLTGVFCIENQQGNTLAFQIDNIHYER